MAVAMRNLPEWVVAFWAAAALGAIIVPLNGWWTGPELAYGLEDSGTKVAVVDPERLARIAPHLDDLRRGGLEQVVVARAGDGPAGPGLSGIDRYEDVLAAGRRLGGADERGSRPPTGGGLAGGRRHDLLHLGDDGQAEGGARDPAQHLHEPHEPRLRQRPQRPAGDGGRAGRAPERAGSELLAALGSAFPRHRLPLGSRAEHRRRRQARDDAPLEPRAALWS